MRFHFLHLEDLFRLRWVLSRIDPQRMLED